MRNQSVKAISGFQIDAIANMLKCSIPKSGWRITFNEWNEKRSLSQNALQHCIYDDVSKYLVSKGRTDCTPEWVKDMLKNKFLGWQEKSFTDVVTGEKKTREVLRSTAGLDKGEAFTYTTAILEWSSSIGCEIHIPANCEYRQLMDAQNN